MLVGFGPEIMTAHMQNRFTRRAFMGALAASVVAAGVPLPIGWPTDAHGGPIVELGEIEIMYEFTPGRTDGWLEHHFGTIKAL